MPPNPWVTLPVYTGIPENPATLDIQIKDVCYVLTAHPGRVHLGLRNQTSWEVPLPREAVLRALTKSDPEPLRIYDFSSAVKSPEKAQKLLCGIVERHGLAPEVLKWWTRAHELRQHGASCIALLGDLKRLDPGGALWWGGEIQIPGQPEQPASELRNQLIAIQGPPFSTGPVPEVLRDILDALVESGYVALR